MTAPSSYKKYLSFFFSCPFLPSLLSRNATPSKKRGRCFVSFASLSHPCMDARIWNCFKNRGQSSAFPRKGLRKPSSFIEVITQRRSSSSLLRHVPADNSERLEPQEKKNSPQSHGVDSPLVLGFSTICYSTTTLDTFKKGRQYILEERRRE